MQIPNEYLGHWSGEVVDANRKKPYKGEIFISADTVSSIYHMAQGSKRGLTTELCTADGFLILKETVGSWQGTLVLYLGSHSKMKCVWRGGPGLNSEATMTKEE